MDWKLPNQPPRENWLSKSASLLTIIAALIGMAALLLKDGDLLPNWLQGFIIFLIVLVAFIAIVRGAGPTMRIIGQRIDLKRSRKIQKRIILQLCDLVMQAGPLFESDRPSSFRSYLRSLKNATIQQDVIYQNIRRLSERMDVLSDWHWTLRTYIDSALKADFLYVRRIQGVIRFYRDVADVARELSQMKLADSPEVVALANDFRILREKYNRHLDRLEQILAEGSKVNTELNQGEFARL